MKPTRQLEPGSNSTRWYIHHDGRRQGPYPQAMVEQWVRQGEVAADALLTDGGAWITLDEFRQRAGLVGSPPPVSSGGSESSESGLGGATTAIPSATNELAAALDAVTPSQAGPADSPCAGRDRIVILGRRQAGKTTFLATLYAQLWRSLDGLRAKALTGETHQRLMSIHQMLRSGQWPDATLGTSRIEMEVEYHGRRMLLVTLDFAGELFSRAFMQDQLNAPESRDLLEHIDRAAAVLLLVDPASAAGRDAQAVMDDDFGIVQAVDRIRNWPGGEHVPIALVLTKMDQNQRMVDRFGGLREFARRHFPALARTVPGIHVFATTAAEAVTDIAGRRRPRPRASICNIDAPLRHCLRVMVNQQDQSQVASDEQWQQQVTERTSIEQARRDHRQNMWLLMAILGLSVVGIGVTVLILVLRL